MDLDSAEQSRIKRPKLEHRAPPLDFLTRLPRELVLEIFSKLPVSSLLNVMYVCRSWRSLAQDPSIAPHLSGITKNNQCLIFHCDTPIRSQVCLADFISSPGNIQKVTNLLPIFTSSMPEFDVVASWDGVLCLFDSLFGDKLYLYNPFTNFFKQFPQPVKHPNQESVIGFGFVQKTQEFKVVQVISINPFKDYPRETAPPCSRTLILSLGSSKWRDIGEVEYHFVQCTSQILVNGRLHWVTQPRKRGRNRWSALVSFDLTNEVYEHVPIPYSETLKKYEFHLLVIKGCLSAAFYCRRGRLEIWVMKNYGVKESWIKEFSIRNHVPKGLKENYELDFWGVKFLKTVSRAKSVRAVCVLDNGEILLEFKGKALATYDPTKRKFKDLQIQGIPNWFQVIHAGSFNWIHALPS
ncbi:F-box protein At3g07870-like [Neltuma alba]|uniref:F-box protein At3g07870-like n=1 Tax=Neltuma alba TaxID=207710 RepID=UPI0010A3AEDC|nr:F-box protein At3g07870-like [Prosopis alba]